jgi:NAD(P)-dependent dehydrogenase (short-subunit alcohol dehydrogenase family)
MNATHIALVTGASRGLGAVLARLLAERGYTLVLGARHAADLDETAAALRATGAAVTTVAGDVADGAVRDRLITTANRAGGLHLLVNNASELGGIAPLTAFDLPRLQRVWQVNLVAPLALMQLAVPLLAASRGLVVNLSSDAATAGYAGWGAYGASKAALDLVSRTAAGELRDRGVSVVSVDPGDMRTRMHEEAFPGEDISDRPLPEVTRAFWQWLLDQDPRTVTGRRFLAQQDNALWAATAR